MTMPNPYDDLPDSPMPTLVVALRDHFPCSVPHAQLAAAGIIRALHADGLTIRVDPAVDHAEHTEPEQGCRLCLDALTAPREAGSVTP